MTMSLAFSETRVQLALTIIWGVLIIPGVLFWRESVPFLVLCSVYANFVGHLSSYEAAKGAERVEEKLEKHENGET